MKINNIPLESIKAKSILRNGDTGKVILEIEKDELHMITLVEGLSKKHQNYAYIEEKFNIPFRIEMTLKANSPGFKLKIGKGYIFFSGSFNHPGFGIRRTDILTGREETTKYDIDNVLPINEYVDLSVVYGSKKMWIEINGQPCYYTCKAPYMNLLENNTIIDEFDLSIACGENVELNIKSLVITEYESNELYIPDEIEKSPELSAFEWYIKSLPHEVRNEVIKTDEFLMKDMKKGLKFKKSIDKDGKLYYDSPCGFQYTMQRYSIGELHFMFWNQERISNFGTVLNKLAESSPELANKIFNNIYRHLNGRGGCQQCSSIDCQSMKTIEFNDETRQACKGALQFKWVSSEFEDVRKVVSTVNEIVKSRNIID